MDHHSEVTRIEVVGLAPAERQSPSEGAHRTHRNPTKSSAGTTRNPPENFSVVGSKARFAGATYSPGDDDARLSAQQDRVKQVMSDGQWRTLADIGWLTGDPAASISAQLRHMRKPRFGSYVVERKSSGDRARGLYLYRVLPPGSATPKPKRKTKADEHIAQLEHEVERLKTRLQVAILRIYKLEVLGR